MVTTKFFYYLTRIKALGLVGLTTKFRYKMRQKKFIATWKQKALEHRANHSWQQINKTRSFESFFTKMAQKTLINDIWHDEMLKALLPIEYTDHTIMINRATQAMTSSFSMLGSPLTTFEKEITWQEDFKIIAAKKIGFRQTHNFLGAHVNKTFYHDIHLTPPKQPSCDDYYFDIKVPWELSRLQHLLFFGQAYQHFGDKKQKQQALHYAQAFQQHINSWIDNNPALLGVNWVCAMDVAIRALNLIWVFHFFKTEPSIPQTFWEKLVCSLYDHLIYLENNWEYSDKPNNHYLAELLGYLYLCSFFDTKQKSWAAKKLWSAFEHQVQPDGTSYEGSTSYHRLITELYLHFFLLCKHQNITLPAHALEKLNAMITFLQQCTDQAGNLVQIGDNDSGKIVTGICILPTTKNHTTIYPHFGLTIIKHNDWHMTLRHATFTPQQPSGHFHHDQWSITLSLGTIPILIDPGSYLYTANSSWRNVFRSATSHSTFYIAHDACQQPEPELFQLTKPCLHAKKLRRRLTFDERNEQLFIEDWQEQANQNTKFMQCHWTFMFHPAITLKSHHEKTWVIIHHEQPIATFNSPLPLTFTTGFYAPAYGVRQECQALTGIMPLTTNITHRIQKI